VNATESIKSHYPEYLMEGAELGLFMVSASFFATLLWHPQVPISEWINTEWLRRFVMGLAMGLTAVGLIYSPWGRRSGAHFNPAVTVSMLRLKKISPWDAVFYIAAQFIGGLLGVLLVAFIAGSFLDEPAIWYVPTTPGQWGISLAFVTELVMSGGLMLMVLVAAESKRVAPLTGVIAGVLLMLYITVAAPISGVSINPARTVASAIPSGTFTSLWIYFAGPIAGMLLAVGVFRALGPGRRITCCGLNHRAVQCRVFRCGQDHWRSKGDS